MFPYRADGDNCQSICKTNSSSYQGIEDRKAAGVDTCNILSDLV